MMAATTDPRRGWLFVGLFVGAVVVITIALVLAGTTPRPASMPEGWTIIRPPRVVLALAEDGEQVWAGGPDGIWSIDRRTGTLRPEAAQFAVTYVFDICVSRDGALWVAHRGGVSRRAAGQWRTFTATDGLPAGQVSAVLESRDRAVWVGTETGVTRFDGATWRTFGARDGLGAVPVDVIFEDRDGVLWFGSASPNRGGISRYDGRHWRAFTAPTGPAHNSVHGIMQDRSGALWFATGIGDRGGASRLRDGRWMTLTARDGLAAEKARSIFEDRDGRLWIGSESRGIAVRARGATVILTPKDGLAGWEVMEMLQDRDGVLWLATEDGITRIASAALPRPRAPSVRQ